MEKGVKHLVKCRCILPQFKNKQNAPFHQFVVFSILDENDVLATKFAQCNNCGIIHKVVDICKSEILPGRENLGSVLTLDEIKIGLPEQLVAVLEAHQADLSIFEYVRWILENQRWGEHVVLSSDLIDDVRQGKYIRIIGENLFKVDNFVNEDSVDLKGL